MHSEQLGGLNCVVSDLGGELPAELVAIFCHGFGAPGTDLVPLADELGDRLGDRQEVVQFVFPAAPLSLDRQGIPGGRAWWPIDIIRLQTAIAQGEFRDLRNDSPPLLPDMREHLTELIHEVRENTGLPLSRIVLGGFSQGAMLATDVALRLSARPGGLVIWSGSLMCESEWRIEAARLPGMHIVQSHGKDDPILPFSAAEWLRDLLVEAGHHVEFLSFRGGHAIPEPAIQAAAALLRSLLSRPPVG